MVPNFLSCFNNLLTILHFVTISEIVVAALVIFSLFLPFSLARHSHRQYRVHNLPSLVRRSRLVHWNSCSFVDCLAAPMYEYYFHMGVPMERHSPKHQADHEEKSEVDWGSLSEEILEHIFARMPIKEAVRASCVCRHWQSIVDSRSFVTFILQFRMQKR